MKNFWNILTIVAQIFAFILSIILIYQISKIILGGSWSIEDAILAFVIANITLTFGLFAKIMNVDKKLHWHIQGHKGRNN